MKELSFRLNGCPKTKKNSTSIISNPKTGRPMLIQSKAYRDYEHDCVEQLARSKLGGIHITEPVNIRCVYCMPTRRKVDLTNLLSATMDILVKADVIADDNRNVAAGNDGSRVYFDKMDPRVVITISEVEEGYEQWKTR